MKLTVMQKKFADHYLKTGNATESYKVAGYKWKNEAVANVGGIQTLKNPKVTDYISKRSKKIDEKVFEEQVTARKELLKRLDSVKHIDLSKNTVKDLQYTIYDEQGNPIRVNEKGVPVNPNDITRMLELLAKITGEIGNDEQDSSYEIVQIENDIG